MNAIRIRTCETPIWISSESEPFSRARVTRRSRPQPTSATETTVRIASTQTTRRRTSSLTVSRAMTITTSALPDSASSSRKRASSEPRPGSTAWTRPPAATSAATRSGIRSAASGRTESQSPSSVDGAEGRGGCPARVAQVGHAQAHPVGGDDLVERPGRDDPAVVEDDHAVAHPLDLGQQVRVEDHRRAAVAGGAHDRTDVGATDRDRAPTSARRAGRGRGRRAARRRARAAAASPSRTR